MPHEFPTPLSGRTIAVPESRELDVLEQLLIRRGAAVHRCPLVSIVDAPDPQPVLLWLQAFLRGPPDYCILMTGEGVNRLRGFAERGGLCIEQFSHALKQTTLISRGMKPARALRSLGLQPDHFAPQPTTAGVIELLGGLNLAGRTVAVQLYGDDPNERLATYLESRQAEVLPVAPYRYAAELSRDGIAMLVAMLAACKLDAIVFTSQAQVDRLIRVCTELGIEVELRNGMANTIVAAIGPVVSACLVRHGLCADVAPDERFFMKPLVQALSNLLR